MKLTALTATIFTMGALATPGPTPTLSEQDTAIPNLEWQVQITPDKTITLTGTIEDVFAQLVAGAGGGDQPSARSGSPSADAWAAPDGAAVDVKRATDFSGGSYYCGGPWPYANLAAFWGGMRYLRSIQAAVHMLPGPGNCGRVSCMHGSAVWVCNDRREEWWLDSFDRVADGLSFVISHCTTTAINGNPMVAGQLFHPDNWNIIVRNDDSC